MQYINVDNFNDFVNNFTNIRDDKAEGREMAGIFIPNRRKHLLRSCQKMTRVGQGIEQT